MRNFVPVTDSEVKKSIVHYVQTEIDRDPSLSLEVACQIVASKYPTYHVNTVREVWADREAVADAPY